MGINGRQKAHKIWWVSSEGQKHRYLASISVLPKFKIPSGYLFLAFFSYFFRRPWMEEVWRGQIGSKKG
jgi:hypothetical protein